MSPDTDTPMRVLVAGGGVAGLEALLALRDLAGGRVELTLLAPEREFTYRPMAVAVPFARGHMQRRDLADIARDTGAQFVRGALAEVDADSREAVLADGRRLGYDALLVAVGAGSEPAYSRVRTWTPELDQDVFGGLLADLEEGYAKKIAFVIPPQVAWPLPAYELALMTAWDARDMGQDDVQVTVYTPEDAPLAIFGEQASAGLRSDLEEAGVAVRTGTVVEEDPAAPARLTAGGAPLESQRIVALPRAIARGIGGLPADGRGFIPVDGHGRVDGVPGVWAAGDAIAFPVKQGGLAAQQANAAAEAIAADAGAGVTPAPFHPVLRGVLLTGRGRQWIRRDLGGDDAEGEAARHALWWPPTKVAGRYLAPYLAKQEEAEFTDADRPAGELVEFTVEGHGG
ncbi:MAG TPA: FAD-dependent oxidoreductase [Solirubrobacteraceae bacterium]|nr:FAD-dependent oxidoreductase [Solirubrobacteraceae bacterium]